MLLKEGALYPTKIKIWSRLFGLNGILLTESGSCDLMAALRPWGHTKRASLASLRDAKGLYFWQAGLDRQARTLIKLLLRIRSSYGQRGGPRGTAPRAAVARRAAALESIYSTHADVPDFPREKSPRLVSPFLIFRPRKLRVAEASARNILSRKRCLRNRQVLPYIYIYIERDM